MPPRPRRPNILFLLTDQHRFDAVGYVNPTMVTPHLDGLAARSLNFQRAYATSPSCVPSRASIFTGKYPSRCGCPTYAGCLPEQEITFMACLQDAGYHTAVVGKQHFHGSQVRRGHDYEEIVDVHGLMALQGKLSRGESVDPTGQNESALSTYEAFCAAHGVACEADVFKRGESMSGRWTGDMRFHVDSYIGERGKEWLLTRRPESQPWFLCVSFPGPHNPYDCEGTSYAELYPEKLADAPNAGESDLAGKPPGYSRFRSNVCPGASKMEEIRRGYKGNISLIDEKIGAILQALKTTGQFDDTLIIFSSDHGDFMGEFGRIAKGEFLAEALMRVPLLVKPPLANFSGRAVPDLVSLKDIAATCLAVAGAPIPDEMSSFPYSAYWQEGGSPIPQSAILMEAGRLKGVRTDDWKLVYYLDQADGELYNLKSDPWEKVNLWDSLQHLEVRDELKSVLISQIIKLLPDWNAPWVAPSPLPTQHKNDPKKPLLAPLSLAVSGDALR